MNRNEIHLDDFSEEHVIILNTWIKAALDKSRWNSDFIKDASEDDMYKLKLIKVNILLEGFVKYHELYSSNAKKLTEEELKDTDFHDFMNKVYFLTMGIDKILPKFNLNTIKDETLRDLISCKIVSHIPCDIPFFEIQGVSTFVKTEHKNHKLSYLNGVLQLHSNMVDYNPQNMNDFIAKYLKMEFRLDWVDYCIIQSFISYEIYQVLDKHYMQDIDRLIKITQYRDRYLSQNLFDKIYTNPTSVKYIILKLTGKLVLPILMLFSFISRSYYLFALFSVGYFFQLANGYYFSNKLKDNLSNNLAENIDTLINLKLDLTSGSMNIHYMIDILRDINRNKDFHLSHLITVLMETKKNILSICDRIDYKQVYINDEAGGEE